MGKIALLDELTANQIAAGEVIERPVSVVKELIENALDAGATNITVEINDGGLGLIKISDDGSGMSKEDLLLAVKRHATSKLRNISDLESLSTLGFRGEALASIVSVAKVEIITREEKDANGHILIIEGNQLNEIEPCGAPVGTSILVKDLFFNTPARRKFLRTPGYEAGLIHELVMQLALGNPEVNFRMVNGGKEILNTYGVNKLEELIILFYGREAKNSLIKVEGRTTQATFSGYLTLPTFHRGNRKAIHFFVNNRKVQAKEIMQAVENAYENTLPKGRFPLAVLNIDFDPALLDVNVHPGKLEIRIRDQLFIPELTALLKEEISSQQKIPSLNIKPNIISEDLKSGSAENSHLMSHPKKNTVQQNGPLPTQEVIREFYSWQPEIDSINKLSQLAEDSLPIDSTPILDPSKDTNESPQSSQSGAADEVSAGIKEELGETEEAVIIGGEEGEARELLPPLRVLGQLAQTFILAEGEDGLYIIDQHVAHERVLFESLLDQAAEGSIQSQVLIAPQTVELTVLEEELLIQHILPITDLGLVIEYFGPRTYLLRAVPSVVEGDPADFLLDLIQILETRGDSFGPAEIRKEFLITASCKGAVKAGAKLSNEGIIQLLADLAKCRNPLTCPHGRPIVYQLTHQDLLKAFRRA